MTDPATSETAPIDGGGRGVLLLGAFAPPRGGPNAQRVGAIAEYLASWSWMVDLFALKTPELQAIEDTMHQRMMDAGARVTWVDEQPAASPWPWRIDGEQPWAEAVVRRAIEAAPGRRWDVVLATSPPFSALWAGHEIARALGLPLIIDLQDPWTLAELWPFRSGIHLMWNGATHRRVSRDALAVVMNCPEAAKAVRRAFRLDPAHVHAVENGFDASEVAPVTPLPRDAGDATFRLVHIGTMMTDEGMRQARLRPSSPRERLSRAVRTTPAATNTLAKSSYYLLHALRHGLSRSPTKAGRIRIEFVGPWSDADQSIVDELGLQEQVIVHPFAARADAMARCKSANAVVLPLHTRRDGKPIRIVPSKTYDYLACGQPILCLCEPCDAWGFIEEAQRGVRAAADDPPAIWAAIETLMQSGDRFAGGLSDPAVRRFDWPALIARLSAIVDSVAPMSAQGDG
ncbi:MAG: glycosyltransferase [Phycisphaerales bacterium]|nr:glycosyltransferase [Phycisphaerales bacterium]